MEVKSQTTEVYLTICISFSTGICLRTEDIVLCSSQGCGEGTGFLFFWLSYYLLWSITHLALKHPSKGPTNSPSSLPQVPSAQSFSLLFRGHSLYAITLDNTLSYNTVPLGNVSAVFMLHPRLWTPYAYVGSHLLKCICSDYSLVAQMVKNLPAMWETWVWSLGQEDPLEKRMATHSSIFAWRIPWMEEPGRLQSTGLQRVREFHEWITLPLSQPLFPGGLLPHYISLGMAMRALSAPHKWRVERKAKHMASLETPKLLTASHLTLL